MTYPKLYPGGENMPNQKNTNQQGNQITKGVKNTAGAAFHAVHKALEKTEFAAMNTVDKTAKMVNGSTNKAKKNTVNSPSNSNTINGSQKQ